MQTWQWKGGLPLRQSSRIILLDGIKELQHSVRYMPVTMKTLPS